MIFKDTFVESAGKSAITHRYLNAVSILLNTLLLLALILWPLVHPLALPKQALTMLLVAPAPPAQPAHLPPAVQSTRVENTPQVLAIHAAIQRIHTRPVVASLAPAPPLDTGALQQFSGTGSGTNSRGGNNQGIPEAIGSAPVLAQVRPPDKIVISSGVMAGNKISGDNPTYPAIARTAHIEGTVVLQATISKAGTIENLRLVSGPPMLVGAAIFAVKSWRYKPYLLNDAPVEVETTININFRLGN